MLPDAHRDDPQEAAKRQANLITLRFFESKLPRNLFEQVVANVTNFFINFSQVQDQIELPQRMDWQGQLRPLKFEEAKLNFSQFDQNYLTQLLQNQSEGTGHQSQKKDLRAINAQNSQIQKSKLLCGGHQNLLLKSKELHLENFVTDQKRNLKNYQISRYQRVKTVFGHSQIQEGYHAPIYNVLFDQTGSFVISGADDGIIKIWDRETMNLQASLHSHQDVITDMDMSKCNNYLATSSQDGKLLIWDWKKCQKVDEIAAHAHSINNIKFFQLKLKSQGQKEPEKIQILTSCSDDGTIKIFDEVNFVNSLNQANNNLESQQIRRSRGRPEASSHKKERYFQCLTPDDFRPGQGYRNKKIDSININQHGLVAAGTNTGDIYLWKLDIQKFKQQQPKAFTWLGLSRKHSKAVHFCEFSPNGKYLFTGSIDGTAKVWNVEPDKDKKNADLTIALTDSRLLVTMEECQFDQMDKHIYFKNKNGEQVNYAEYKQNKSKWQCDCIVWSCHGRYAICSLSGETQNNNNVSVIKIWDSYTNKIIQDIAKDNNMTLPISSFVISAHPKQEDIFFSGSDGGVICLWNIKERKLIKKFIEYGIYSFEKYTLSKLYDGKFSPDGSSFVVSSDLGNLSLFSCESAGFKYEATRVDQFFINDDVMHSTNIYYDRNEEPQVCNFNLMAYEAQPPSSLIGKFKNQRKLTNEEYERNLAVRQEMARQEEEFIQSLLEEGLRNEFFANGGEQAADNFVEFNEDEVVNQPQRNRGALRGRLNSQLSQISNNNQNQVASQEDEDIVEQLNRRGNRGRGMGRRLIGGRRQVEEVKEARPILTNIDPDNSFYDRDSDENFEMEENVYEEEEESDNAMSDDDSEDFKAPKFQRANYHVRNDNNRENQRGGTTERVQTRNQNQPTRYERMLRRQQRTGQHEQESDNENVGRRPKRLRRSVVRSDEPSASEDDDYDISNLDESEEIKPKRNLRRGNRHIDSDEDMEESQNSSKQEESENESEFSGVRTRRARNKGKNDKNQNKNKKTNNENGRSLRKRRMRKNYEESDDSAEDFIDYEEQKEVKKSSQEGGKDSHGKRSAARILKEESESEDVDQDVTVPDQIKKMKGDEDYELDETVQIDQNEELKCEFCQRTDQPLTGPFIKVNQQSNGPEGPLYFHKDCVEVNNYSFYNNQKQKWMNIGKALEMLERSNHMCKRCGYKGATIKCQSCSKHYHGHNCSTLYMILAGGQNYQCFECRNRENFKNFNGKDLLEKQELKQTKKAMIRNHLLASKQDPNQYVPQVNDLVYYFYQGHEKFISYYNCYFYQGDEQKLKFDLYPWKVYPILETPKICRITKITYSFPSKNTLYLIKRFGKSSNIHQIPQIVIHLELKIEENNSSVFNIDYFPNELPDFLVLKNLYENSLYCKIGLEDQGQFIGQIFQTRNKNMQRVQLVSEIEKERDYNVEPTGWESIQVKPAQVNNNQDRGRRGQRRQEVNEEPSECLNFWELILKPEMENNLHFKGNACAFDDDEIQRILDIIIDYTTKNKEQTAPFLPRVTDKVASDYRYHVSAEMYMELVQERLINKYYRSQEQLFSDLDLISYNALIYNGDDNPLTRDARRMVEKLRCEIKKVLNYSDDVKRQKHEENKGLLQYSKPIGKLTAPPLRNNGNKTSSMSQFRNNLIMEDLEETKQQQISTNFDGTNKNVENNNMVIQIHIPPNYNLSNDQTTNQNQLLSYTNNDASYGSDMKITPNNKIQIQTNAGSNQQLQQQATGQSRRTRGQANNNNNSIKAFDSDNIQGDQYGTGEKISIRNSIFQSSGNQQQLQQPATTVNSNNEPQEDQQNLGKRTRSGRQTRQVRNNLNEDADDRQFESMIREATEKDIMSTNKRIRQN